MDFYEMQKQQKESCIDMLSDSRFANVCTLLDERALSLMQVK